MLCRFVSGSYMRPQDSFSVIKQFKKFGAASTPFRQNTVKPLSAPASDRQSSDVAQDDSNFLILKFWLTICNTYLRLICSSSAIMRIVNR
ncbi:hypothetical protein TNCV_4927161 [Trichonephila clavipes]|nr:hypothetical protein TNCV_4927161 [Trichonephila clavipes]